MIIADALLLTERYRFQRPQRLLNKAAFQSVFDQADIKIGTSQFLVLARNTADSDVARLGLIVAKKHLKTAVARNRFKRQVREAFRLRQHQLQGLDIIVMARSGKPQAAHNNQVIEPLQQVFFQALTKLARKRHPGLSGGSSPP